jgi:hypothetical protein
MEDNQSLLQDDLRIDSITQSYLSETAKWTNFLGIMGFIFSGLIAIAAFFMGTILTTTMNTYGNGGTAIGGGVITVVYLILAAVNFFMALFLYRFAQKMKIALQANDQLTLNESFLNLKKLFKLAGILTIVYLAFLALIIIIAVVVVAIKR